MIRAISNDYAIKTTDDPGVYEGLRELWCVTFGDEPEYVDATYDYFGGDIRGYAAVDRDGQVASCLTLYKCGVFEDRPVYVSYAVCTREDSRGLGLAGSLSKAVMEEVISQGGISIVSPAERSLEDFYAGLGYEPYFFVSERAVMSPDLDADEFDDFDDYDMDFGTDETEPLSPALELKRIDAGSYSRYREAFLSGRPHVELSPAMMRLAEAESMGGCGLYSINGGDAVCIVEEAGPARVVLTELLVSPVLLEISGDIDSEIASMIAKHFDAAETVYRTPGWGRCQSMAAGLTAVKDTDEFGYMYEEAYYGFPVD